MSKPRILFFAEAVTLAHVARPFALAQALDPELYDIHFASHDRYSHLLPKNPFRWHPLRTIESAQFLAALSKGSPVYDTNTLSAYVREDLAIIDEVKPNLLVGDFRLSLAISAAVTRITYMAITNAYWSPYAKLRFPVPDLPLTKVTGLALGQILFDAIRPIAFAYHALPLNRVRREYGLPDLGNDLRRVYTHADYTLYADIPELVPTCNLPGNHHYLGAIPWSPAVSLPQWWDAFDKSKPVIYVTLGSSGNSKLLPTVLQALAPLPVTVIAATANLVQPTNVPNNVFIANYLPGQKAAERADVVICNGGSLTTQQALISSKPVLGIVHNMDQHLNMMAVQRVGAGILLRSSAVAAKVMRHHVIQLLTNPNYRYYASAQATNYSRYDFREQFLGLTAKVISSRRQHNLT